MDTLKVNDKLVLDRPLLEQKIGKKMKYNVVQVLGDYITFVPMFEAYYIENEPQTGHWKVLVQCGWCLEISS